MKNPFTEHPNSVGETYFEHMWKAFMYILKFQLLSIFIYIHAILPFLFEHTTSDEIEKINKELQGRKNSGTKNNTMDT